MSVVLSPALSLAARNNPDVDGRSRGSPRSAATTAGDTHSIFSVSIYHFQAIGSSCLPVTHHPESTKGVYIPEKGPHSATKRPDRKVRLFPVTRAEKCQLATCNPILFSNAKYLELISDQDACSVQRTFKISRDSRKASNTRRIATDTHPLLANPPFSPALTASQELIQPLVKPTKVSSKRGRLGVKPEEIKFIWQTKSEEYFVEGEVIEMGDPFSPLRRAVMRATAAGYQNHNHVILGVESQPIGLQFTRAEAGYERVNLLHEWFRACCEFEEDMELPVYCLIGSMAWEQALQNACNQRYDRYIENSCHFETPLPPRLDLRPLELERRCLKYEVFSVPMHEWNADEEQEEEKCIWIRGGYSMDTSSLRREVFLGDYQPNHDPHMHILFQQPIDGAERWRARNITEDGTLYRKSRRDAQPTQYKYKGVDLPWLFTLGGCRRFFPRLQPIPSKDL